MGTFQFSQHASVGRTLKRLHVRPVWLVAVGVLASGACAAAGAIDTAWLEQPWPGQRVRQAEVGKYAVRWRQRLSRQDGLFFGVRFTAPTDRPTTWDLATADYAQLGKDTPGVTAVRYLEDTPARQVIQIDVKVLWRTLRLNFEVERDPPRQVRFRLTNPRLGEYRGVFILTEPTVEFRSAEPAATGLDLLTWLKPAQPVPLGLLAAAQRMVILRGTKEFLQGCEAKYRRALGQAADARPLDKAGQLAILTP